MLTLVGPVPLVVLSRLLALAVLFPFGGAVLALWLARGERDRSAPALAWVALTPALVALVSGLAGLAELGSLPAGYTQLVGFAAPLVRVGSLDVSLGLALDGVSAPPLVLGAALLLAAQAWTIRRPGPARADVVAALSFLGGASFLVLLADGTFTLALGAALEGLAVVLLASRVAPDPTTAWARLVPPAVLAHGALTLAVVFTFWGAAGGFTPDGYVADGRARFLPIDAGRHTTVPKGIRVDDDDDAPVAKGPKQTRAEQGSLTMLAAPGAKLFLDGAATPFATTPFVRKALARGGHVAHLVLGDGTEDLDLAGFTILSGTEATLTVIAPTTTFRDLAALVRARDIGGPLGVGARLAAAAKSGSLLAWILILAAVAALLRAAAAAFAEDAAPGRLAAVALLPAMTGVYVVARLGVVFGGEVSALVGLGAIGALALGVAAWRTRDPGRAVALTAAAHGAVALAATGAGAPIVGILHTVAAAAAAALTLWAIQASLDGGGARAATLAKVGAACLGFVPPGVGVAWTALDALRHASSGVGAALVALALAGASIGAAACFRVASALVVPAPAAASPEPTKVGKRNKKASEPASPPPPPQAPGRASVASLTAHLLTPFALTLGLLGSTSWIDGALARLARSASPPGVVLVATSATPLVLGLSVLLAAALAWTRARAPRADDDVPTSPRGMSLLELLTSIGRAANAVDAAVAHCVPTPPASAEEPRR